MDNSLLWKSLFLRTYISFSKIISYINLCHDRMQHYFVSCTVGRYLLSSWVLCFFPYKDNIMWCFKTMIFISAYFSSYLSEWKSVHRFLLRKVTDWDWQIDSVASLVQTWKKILLHWVRQCYMYLLNLWKMKQEIMFPWTSNSSMEIYWPGSHTLLNVRQSIIWMILVCTPSPCPPPHLLYIILEYHIISVGL